MYFIWLTMNIYKNSENVATIRKTKKKLTPTGIYVNYIGKFDILRYFFILLSKSNRDFSKFRKDEQGCEKK